MTSYRRCYLFSQVITALIFLVLWAVFGHTIPFSTVFFAFILTSTLSSLVFYAHARIAGVHTVRAFYGARAVHLVRLGGFPALFWILHRIQFEPFLPFVAVTLTGFVSFFIFEVLGLFIQARTDSHVGT